MNEDETSTGRCGRSAGSSRPPPVVAVGGTLQDDARQIDGNTEAMSEPTTTPLAEPGASIGAPAPDDDRRLKRILYILVAVTAVLFAVFAVVYYLGQRVDAAPSIPDQAVVKAEAAVKDAPNDIAARLQLANVYAQFGRPDDALSQFNEILKAQPKNRAALLGVGAMLSQKGDLAGAKSNYEAFIKTSGKGEFSAADPQLEQAYYFLGVTNLGLSDVPGAVKALESALVIDKTDADAWFSLGEAQSRAGDYKTAAEAYTTALTFIPSGWCDPYAGLQTAYSKLGDKDGVTFAKGMESICKGSGSDGVQELTGLSKGKYQLPALLGLGLAAEHDGNSSQAIEYYTKAAQLDPTNVAARTALARLGAASAAPSASASPAPSGSAS